MSSSSPTCPSQSALDQHGSSRAAQRSSPVLLQPLPPSLVLQRESIAQSELELDRQIRQLERERQLAEALQDQEFEVERARTRDEVGTWVKGKSNRPQAGKGEGDISDMPTKGFRTPPQAYELYQAIDKHDIDFIMRVRDHAFDLLLQKNAGEFPIIYASRIGSSHKDIVILLIGALSRYVNRLDEEDFDKKEVKNTLKALRSNLKLAIDNALSTSPSLLSSYLQVLIMSEGDSWLHKAVYEISLLLRETSTNSTTIKQSIRPSSKNGQDPGTNPLKSTIQTSSRPVHMAEEMVRHFCTKELKGVPGGIQGVEEYIANAALDLVLMAAWSIAANQLGEQPLPTYTFARDLRTYALFAEAVNHANLSKLKSKSIRSILEKLVELGGDTKKSVRGRLRDVELALDKE